MTRRLRSETALWAGLIVLGVCIGILVTPVHVSARDPEEGGDDDAAAGDVKFDDHKCKEINCAGIVTSVGGLCGECTGDLILDPFWKCVPSSGDSCIENATTFGTIDCIGVCSLDPLRACNHGYTKCQ